MHLKNALIKFSGRRQIRCRQRLRDSAVRWMEDFLDMSNDSRGFICCVACRIWPYGLIERTAWGFDPISVLYHGDHADVRSTRSKEAPVRMVVPAKRKTAASRRQVEATTVQSPKSKVSFGVELCLRGDDGTGHPSRRERRTSNAAKHNRSMKGWPAKGRHRGRSSD